MNCEDYDDYTEEEGPEAFEARMEHEANVERIKDARADREERQRK